MDQTKCKDCAYFRQHYILNDSGLPAIQCGHCTYIRAKTKRPEANACAAFTAGTPDTARFATRTYLTQKLLQYTLELELLPEILALTKEQTPPLTKKGSNSNAAPGHSRVGGLCQSASRRSFTGGRHPRVSQT